MIALTHLARHLKDIAPANMGLLYLQAEGESRTNDFFAKTRYWIASECASFTERYLESPENFDNQCSYDNVITLVNKKAEEEFYWKMKAADEAVTYARQIFDKYNDITRVYNSMDCRQGQEKRDMEIIEMYMKELNGMVGHDIDLDRVNEEHDIARSTLNQKITEREVITDKTRKRAYELMDKIDTDVLFTIYSYAESITHAFSTAEMIAPESDRREGYIPASQDCGGENKSSFSEPKQNRRRGRPSKKEVYAKAGIEDFKSCFINEAYYDHVVQEIKKEPANSITGKVSRCIIGCLFSSGQLKKEMRSTDDLTQFMINDFSTQFKITKGSSGYNYGISEKDENKWKQRLSVREHKG